MEMQDLALEQDNDGTFDYIIDPDTKDFKIVQGMETAFSVQLFTNQRVSKEEISNPLKREGWIGDMLTRDEGYQVGSLIFLKQQSRDTVLDNNETAEYAKDALNYFVAIGASKEVNASVLGKNIEGDIINDANNINRYSKLWRNTNAT